MLPKALTVVYELFHGKQDPVFRDQVYLPAGVILLISTFLLCFLYYYLLNGLRARFGKAWPHWAMVLIINVALNAAAVLVISYRVGDLDVLGIATLLLCVINAIYAAIAFLVATVALKWWSPNARCTPF